LGDAEVSPIEEFTFIEPEAPVVRREGGRAGAREGMQVFKLFS
jgi:hypothetical protein